MWVKVNTFSYELELFDNFVSNEKDVEQEEEMKMSKVCHAAVIR